MLTIGSERPYVPSYSVERISGPLFILEVDLEKVYGEPSEEIEGKCCAWIAGLPETPRLRKTDACTARS